MLRLIKNKNTDEFYTDERCFITEILNDPASPDLSVARCRVKPGIRTQLHALKDVAETYVIEVGQGFMDDGENEGFKVGPGDAVTIGAGEAQRIMNTGNEDLIFLVICQPRFVPECYLNLED